MTETATVETAINEVQVGDHLELTSPLIAVGEPTSGLQVRLTTALRQEGARPRVVSWMEEYPWRDCTVGAVNPMGELLLTRHRYYMPVVGDIVAMVWTVTRITHAEWGVIYLGLSLHGQEVEVAFSKQKEVKLKVVRTTVAA